jgi:hypothetical protein
MRQEQAIREAEKREGEPALIWLLREGALVSKTRLGQLVAEHHDSRNIVTDGVKLRMPAVTKAGSHEGFFFGAIEEWADNEESLEGLPGRFEVVRLYSLDPAEVDPEIRYLLGLPLPGGFDSRGGPATLADHFRTARTDFLIKVTPPVPEAIFPAEVGRCWADGATRLEDTLPIECGIDWDGPTFLYIRSLKHDPVEMGLWASAEGRSIGKALTGLADRVERRQVAGDVALIGALRQAALDVMGSAGAGAQATGETPASPPGLESEVAAAIPPDSAGAGVVAPSPAPVPPALSDDEA